VSAGGERGPRRTALVIGGARRVGAAITRELSRAGCDVVFTYHTSEAEAAALEAELGDMSFGGPPLRGGSQTPGNSASSTHTNAHGTDHPTASLSSGDDASPAPASERRATQGQATQGQTTQGQATQGQTAQRQATKVRLEMHDASRLSAQIEAIATSRPAWDVLVICASVYTPCSLAEFTPSRAMADYQVNAIAPAMICQTLAPALAASTLPGGGSIVMLGDMHAMGPAGRARRGFLSYSMSKCALTELALVLSRELAPRVRVNVVAPGVVAFPETGPEADEELRAKYLAKVPLKRSGTPQDAATAVRFLALEAAYTTGQVLRVDGGEGV